MPPHPECQQLQHHARHEAGCSAQVQLPSWRQVGGTGSKHLWQLLLHPAKHQRLHQLAQPAGGGGGLQHQLPCMRHQLQRSGGTRACTPHPMLADMLVRGARAARNGAAQSAGQPSTAGNTVAIPTGFTWAWLHGSLLAAQAMWRQRLPAAAGACCQLTCREEARMLLGHATAAAQQAVAGALSARLPACQPGAHLGDGFHKRCTCQLLGLVSVAGTQSQ